MTAGWELEVARIEALHQVSLAWIDLWEAEHRAVLLEAAASDANRLRDIADERFGAGSSPRLDSVRATGDSARARAEARAAALVIDAAGAQLGYFLGGSTETSRTSGDPAIAASLPSLDVLDTANASVEHPLLARDGAAIRAAEAHVSAERRARWPVINGEVTVNWRDPTLGATDVIGGLGLEMPILNLRGGLIGRAQAQKALAQANRDLDAARLGTELRSAHARFAAASLRSRALRRDVLPTLEEARRMTEESYREGRADLVRVLEAQRALTETRLALVDASAAAARAWTDLERALGHHLDGSTSPPEARAR
jgi:outer membrane protein, heavy metal efflux system